MASLGCKPESETACATIGRSGGVLQSLDSVLTIALQPEALDEDTEFCISPSELPPEVAGPAYLVRPNPRLHFDALVSYRHQFPQDISDLNVGRIRASDFDKGKGRWLSLSECIIEPEALAVRCVDHDVSKFYGLLTEQLGPVSDSVADVTTDDSNDVTTDPTIGDSDTAAESTTTGDAPIDYPPECDTLSHGPFALVHVGQLFQTVGADPLGGSEDLAPDGHGGFIARDGTSLSRLDVTGATLGTPEDPGFTVLPLTDAANFTNSSTLGMRYLANGDLAMMQREGNSLQLMHPDGSIDTPLPGLEFPNGLFADTMGRVWFSEYLGGRVSRFDPGSGTATTIAEIQEANGLLLDPLRGLLFYVNYTPSQLWRVAIDASGNAAGEPAMVADLSGFSDGVAMDVCGNLYVVDNGGSETASGRVDRVLMDDEGVMVMVEEIVGDIPNSPANVNFGLGADYGDFETALFISGVPGDIHYVDVGITGAAVPVLAAAPASG
ncbi:MAG: hypothetical protein K1X88_18450 [Nannocystaceae bacterium]|nr:hypothetical protein [Nannocystaceae bacterium]